MFSSIDRVQLCSLEPETVASRWIELLDAKEHHRDHLGALSADRITLGLGNCQLEILSPTGQGPVQAHLQKQAGGAFAAGFATADLESIKSQLADRKIAFDAQDDQIFVAPEAQGIPGLRLVITQRRTPVRHGLMENLYEVTHLSDREKQAADRLAEIYGLNPQHFVPIRSDSYGYQGCLTLVNPDQLDRIEMINPFDPDKTMGRYFGKFGPSLYMCYGECDNLPLLRERLKETVPRDWTGPADGPIDGLFIHPRALGGTMLGVSRSTFAWSWSGSPDRITPDDQPYP
jgi:hypothetical protein